MSFVILTFTQDVAPFLERIATIADQHRDEFGFWPISAYEDLVVQGKLWVATTMGRDKILGYLAFGGSRSSAKIFQLYVDTQARRMGIGSTLIDQFKKHARANHYQVIKARVAVDLSANHFWEKQGFYIIQQVPGGQAKKRIINIRIHELPANCLFGESGGDDLSEWLHASTSVPLLSSPIYALDLNVIFDVITDRPDTVLARRIVSAALQGDFRLRVSQELAEELKRSSHGKGADPVLQFARELPALPHVDVQDLDALVKALRSIVFPTRDLTRRDAENDLSDLRHLAACVYHRASGFVTRERAILRAAATLHEKMGLRVLSPLDLVGPAEELELADVHTDVHCGAMSIQATQFDPSRQREVNELACKLGVPEAMLATILEPGTSIRRRIRLVVSVDARLVAVASWTDGHPGAETMRAYLFADELAVGAQLVIDHLLGAFLRSIPERRLLACELIIARSQILTRSTARLLGFSRKLNLTDPLVGLAKLGYRGIVESNEWARFAAQFRSATGKELPATCPPYAQAMSTGLVLSKVSSNSKRAIELMSFETELSPLTLLTAKRKAVLVPIRDKLGSELLPEVTIQSPLFPKEATVHIERAYFGKALNGALFERGALVVFYISQADGGRGEAVGVGRVTASGSDSPFNLSRSLVRQGVLSVGDLERLVNHSGEVGYFTFDSFTKFARPVSFAELQSMGCIGGANLVTSQLLEFDKLLKLIQRSHGPGETP